MHFSPKDDVAWRLAAVLLMVLLWMGGCTRAPVEENSTPAVMSVAVWELEAFGGGAEAEWGEVFSSAVMEVFESSEGYTVVERERLLLALEELHIGTSTLADEQTRLRIGKMVGARFMVFGGYVILGGGMRLDLRLVEVESGRILRAARRSTGTPSLVGGIAAARSAAGDIL